MKVLYCGYIDGYVNEKAVKNLNFRNINTNKNIRDSGITVNVSDRI